MNNLVFFPNKMFSWSTFFHCIVNSEVVKVTFYIFVCDQLCPIYCKRESVNSSVSWNRTNCIWLYYLIRSLSWIAQQQCTLWNEACNSTDWNFSITVYVLYCARISCYCEIRLKGKAFNSWRIFIFHFYRSFFFLLSRPEKKIFWPVTE